jgi:hypothetical protein
VFIAPILIAFFQEMAALTVDVSTDFPVPVNSHEF